MRFLVTGGNGYLGQRLVKELVERGNNAVLLVLEDSDVSMFNNLDNIKIYTITDDNIKSAMKENIDGIIHLSTLYGRKGEDDLKVLDANLKFPLSVLEEAIKNGVKYFFNMDTAIHKLINSYTITKKQFRDWGEYYGKQGQIRFINIKSEHFYGPHDKNIKFIANMLEQFRNNKPQIETTLGEQERAFIYIDDLIEAFFCIINHEMKNNIMEFTEYEVGPDNNIKIKEALEIMKRVTNSKSEIMYGAIPYRIDEEMKSNCNNEKLKAIGWKQKITSFEEGINKILAEEKYENIN